MYNAPIRNNTLLQEAYQSGYRQGLLNENGVGFTSEPGSNKLGRYILRHPEVFKRPNPWWKWLRRAGKVGKVAGPIGAVITATELGVEYGPDMSPGPETIKPAGSPVGSGYGRVGF